MTNNMVQSPFNIKKKKKIVILFLHFLGQHFPPHNKLHRPFSHSCMPNMNSYTYMDYHKVLNSKPNEAEIDNCKCDYIYLSPTN